MANPFKLPRSKLLPDPYTNIDHSSSGATKRNWSAYSTKVREQDLVVLYHLRLWTSHYSAIALLGYTQREQRHETADHVSLGLLCGQQDITERRSRG